MKNRLYKELGNDLKETGYTGQSYEQCLKLAEFIKRLPGAPGSPEHRNTFGYAQLHAENVSHGL